MGEQACSRSVQLRARFPVADDPELMPASRSPAACTARSNASRGHIGVYLIVTVTSTTRTAQFRGVLNAQGDQRERV